MGRIWSRRIADASAARFGAFVEEAIQPGSLVHTDSWEGYGGLENKGYRHEVTVLRGKRRSASKLLPRVHRVASLLKHWLLGIHQGAVSHEYCGLLPGRVHVPLQPADLAVARQTFLSPPPAGGRRRPCSL